MDVSRIWPRRGSGEHPTYTPPGLGTPPGQTLAVGRLFHARRTPLSLHNRSYAGETTCCLVVVPCISWFPCGRCRDRGRISHLCRRHARPGRWRQRESVSLRSQPPRTLPSLPLLPPPKGGGGVAVLTDAAMAVIGSIGSIGMDKALTCTFALRTLPNPFGSNAASSVLTIANTAKPGWQ